MPWLDADVEATTNTTSQRINSTSFVADEARESYCVWAWDRSSDKSITFINRRGATISGCWSKRLADDFLHSFTCLLLLGYFAWVVIVFLLFWTRKYEWMNDDEVFTVLCLTNGYVLDCIVLYCIVQQQGLGNAQPSSFQHPPYATDTKKYWMLK